MTVLSALAGRLLGYGRRTTPRVDVARDIQVPMRDGVTLLADRYRPRGLRPGPVLLVRTPYGRHFLGGLAWGRLYAERGHQVLIQSVRGTHGSGGEFHPQTQEHEDGIDTLHWLREQPWCDGRIATVGPSYLGYVQWALGPDGANTLAAMSPQVTSGKLPFFVGGTVALQDLVAWSYGVAGLARGEFRLSTQLKLAREGAGRPPRAVTDATGHLPLIEADRVFAGTEQWHWRNWIAHLRPDDDWWATEGGDWQDLAGKYTAPVQLIAGWHDVFLPQQLRDYRGLRAAGQQPQLTIGAWTHGAPEFFRVAAAESLAWLRAHLDNDHAPLRANPVRLFVTGGKDWREFPDWPPPSSEQRWHLHEAGRLAPDAPAESAPDAYRYDPANPTPSLGGAHLGRGAGPRKNNALEARSDVLTYTSAVLDHDLEVIGEIRAELFVTSSAEHADFFVRLCDVDSRGTSINVSDGILRVYPDQWNPSLDEPSLVTVDLWPVAHRFARGHRVRVQVSSGAFPRFARNLGTGEGVTSGSRMSVARQHVYHAPSRQSCVILPVVT